MNKKLFLILAMTMVSVNAVWALDDEPRSCPAGEGWDSTYDDCRRLDATGKLPSGEFPARGTPSEPETAKSPTPDRRS